MIERIEDLPDPLLPISKIFFFLVLTGFVAVLSLGFEAVSSGAGAMA